MINTRSMKLGKQNGTKILNIILLDSACFC